MVCALIIAVLIGVMIAIGGVLETTCFDQMDKLVDRLAGERRKGELEDE